MSDPKELASKARNTLSQALESLQSGDDVPESLIELAAPIAKSMGTLHRIEKSGSGKAEEIDAALDNVRSVLDALQEVSHEHPAVEQAMETVAGSLSKMFALSRALKAAAAPKPEPKPEPKPKAEEFKPTPKTVAMPPEVSEGRLNQGRAVARDPEVHVPPPAAHTDPMPAARTAVSEEGRRAEAPTRVAARPAPTEPEAPVRVAARPAPNEPEAPVRVAARPAPTEPEAPAPRSIRRTGSAPVSERLPSKDKQRVAGTEGEPLPPEGARVQSVELGAFSASNFYKGLSGNDVIEHGGIFVATYQIPKVGTPIAVRVHLPGDLEFDADAVVQWTRDVGEDSEPGYGARFTRVSHEARQLVYRYVRNREPMFYDDL